MDDPRQPQLSDGYIATMRERLADEQFVTENPKLAAMLRATTEAALSQTGQSLAPPSPPTAEQVHAKRFGVALEPSDGRAIEIPGDIGDENETAGVGEGAVEMAAALMLPDHMLTIVEQIVASDEAQPAHVEAALGRERYAASIEAVGKMFRDRGVQLDAKLIPAPQLLQLSHWAGHLAKYEATRPKAAPPAAATAPSSRFARAFARKG